MTYPKITLKPKSWAEDSNGFYSVEVQIKWNQIVPYSSTAEEIEVEQLNISLQVEADKLACEIRKKLEASHDRL